MAKLRQKSLANKSMGLIQSWSFTLLAIIGIAAIAGGLFDSFPDLPWFIFFLAAVIFSSALWDINRRRQGIDLSTITEQIEGPLLWTAIIWMIIRAVGPALPQLTIIPAGFIAWLVVSSSPRIFIFPLTIILLMETILTITEKQTVQVFSINLLCYTIAAGGLLLFANSQMYRRRIKKAMVKSKLDTKTQESARELGLLISDESSLLDNLPTLDELEEGATYTRPIIENINSSFDLQLELLRRSLDLTTVAVLWPDPDKQQLRLRNLASSRSDILQGPYPMGTGITGGLTGDREEVSMAQIKSNYAGLPYYKNAGGIGSIMALRIPDENQAYASAKSGKKLSAILCVDRVAEAEWNDKERKIMQLAAKKLALDVNTGRRLLNLDRERNTTQRLCLGLRELNNGLGLESVFNAAIKAVKALVAADFVAISLADEECHRTVKAEGLHGEKLQGMEYKRNEGLVGQVLKTNIILPAGGRYRGAAPIFSREQTFSEFQSLMIMPLRDDRGTPIGALTVASLTENAFTGPRKEILDLIVDQVAIKIDLGQAHELINKMATTDCLTNMANHRTLQHGFDIMLSRAQRRASALCFILCDIDHFKLVNDTYGHPFGDQVLQEVAKVLIDAVRNIDLPARYGGEEFAIILEDSEMKGGRQMAERIRQDIENMTLRHGNEEIKITMSLGLSLFPNDGNNKAMLIDRADQALYHAKENGRNQTVAWSDLPPPEELD
ncbi:MAG: diguanylate cyclase [Proteobacteria bacterium]|nr:diguanylate cyclase [Pseudomonadota bacterium]MBU1716561.1 diguanylate cyclase [Pseudomonadota bacterium]